MKLGKENELFVQKWHEKDDIQPKTKSIPFIKEQIYTVCWIQSGTETIIVFDGKNNELFVMKLLFK